MMPVVQAVLIIHLCDMALCDPGHLCFYYIYTMIDGKEYKYIMLNPNLARKRKTIDKTCLGYFDKLGGKLME
jgi:hypothetical protein